MCATQFSDLKKIKDAMDKNNGSMIFEKPIPFSKELVANVDRLNPEHYQKKDHGILGTSLCGNWKLDDRKQISNALDDILVDIVPTNSAVRR